jgi:hypothetical protein
VKTQFKINIIFMRLIILKSLYSSPSARTGWFLASLLFASSLKWSKFTEDVSKIAKTSVGAMKTREERGGALLSRFVHHPEQSSSSGWLEAVLHVERVQYFVLVCWFEDWSWGARKLSGRSLTALLAADSAVSSCDS